MKPLSMAAAGISLLSVLYSSAPPVIAASAELWPADRRRNNTLYCYGNDWNMLKIGLYSDKTSSSNSGGRYKIDVPTTFIKDTIVEVTLPAVVEFLGASRSDLTSVKKDFTKADVTENGKRYRRIRIPLDNKALTERMGSGFYDVFIWYMPPECLDGQVRWTLTYDGKVLASSSNRLHTAGVVREGRKLPRRFVFYPYGSYATVPEENFQRMAGFYRRFGMTGIVSSWSYGLPASEGRFHKMLQTNRRVGLKNIAQMDTFCSKWGNGFDTADPGSSAKTKGLVAAMDEACKGIESPAARAQWAQAAAAFDLALYDWEPAGPQTWPGYDDTATLSAFAKAQGLVHPVSAELAKTTYRRAYARYRMEQTARPVYALKRTINAVKPMPLMVEQGDGSAQNIDYDVYGKDFEILRPMTYKPSPIAYARDILEMLKRTAVPNRKFLPDLTVGWPSGGSLRESPDEFLLDTMVSAAAGLGGVAHWPELYRTDAVLFGIHEGLTRIALVEDFYFDGTPTDTVAVSGISYKQTTIDVGVKTLTLCAPDWRPVLLSFVHKLGNEHLVTILNYHTTLDAFVRVNSPALKGLFLVNPVENTYTILDDAGSAIVRIGRESPALWIATADKSRTTKMTRIEQRQTASQLDAAKKTYLQTVQDEAVRVGTVGNIRVTYDHVPFDGDSRVCLRVGTPAQTVFFGESGGRIYDWRVAGIPDFVARNDERHDGIGMDLLWLPDNARWSGDERQPMRLTRCDNDGKEARVVYEGEFTRGLPGVTVRKEYAVPASGASITITVTLTNTLAGPVTLSYWQHHMFMSAAFQLIIGTAAPRPVETAECVAVAANLPPEYHSRIIAPTATVGTVGPTFAQYFPDSEAGVIVCLPEKFMNVYLWRSPQRNVSTSEWMSRPLTIPAGRSETFHYSITAVPRTSVQALRERMK